MDAFRRRLNITVSGLSAIIMVLMMLHVVANAITRSLDVPITGTLEYTEYWYMPALVLLGIIAAQLQGEHITVPIVTDRLKEKNKTEFLLFGRILGIAICIGFAWYGLLRAIDNARVGKHAGSSDILAWPPEFLIPITFLLLAVLFAMEIIDGIKGKGIKGKADGNRSIGRPLDDLESEISESGAKFADDTEAEFGR